MNDPHGTEVVHMSDLFDGIVATGHLKRVVLTTAEVKKYALTEDDILIARRSINYEGAAQPCRIPPLDGPLAFESSIIRIRPDSSRVLPLYLYFYLNNATVREKRVRPYVTISTISGINQERFVSNYNFDPTASFTETFLRRSPPTTSFYALRTSKHSARPNTSSKRSCIRRSLLVSQAAVTRSGLDARFTAEGCRGCRRKACPLRARNGHQGFARRQRNVALTR